MTMARLFGEADLRRVAGERSFGRGQGYLDAVGDLEIGVDQVTATVYGTDAYEVVLDLGDDGLMGGCSCPHGREGFFCKHLVAVGLTVLRHSGDVPAQQAAAAAKARSLEAWLDGLSRDDLLGLVREQVREDRGLRRRLELRAAAAGPDLSNVRARVGELLDVRGFSRYGAIEYADAQAYSSQVDEVVAVIDGLIDSRESAEAVSIAGFALSAVLEALEQADDSDGWIQASRPARVVKTVGLHSPWTRGVTSFEYGQDRDRLVESGSFANMAARQSMAPACLICCCQQAPGCAPLVTVLPHRQSGGEQPPVRLDSTARRGPGGRQSRGCGSGLAGVTGFRPIGGWRARARLALR